MAQIDPRPPADGTGAEERPRRTGIDPFADLTAAPEAGATPVPPEIVAQTLGDYMRASSSASAAGESGMLPSSSA